MAEDRMSPLARYRRGLATSTVNNSSAFGFSVMITATFGMLSYQHGTPSPARVALFALALVAIAGIEAGVSRGFRRRVHRHRSNVVLLGTAGSVGSAAAALAAAYGVGALLPAPIVWLTGSLAAAACYVLVEAGAIGIAERLEASVVGEREAEAEASD